MPMVIKRDETGKDAKEKKAAASGTKPAAKTATKPAAGAKARGAADEPNEMKKVIIAGSVTVVALALLIWWFIGGGSPPDTLPSVPPPAAAGTATGGSGVGTPRLNPGGGMSTEENIPNLGSGLGGSEGKSSDGIP